VVRKLKGDDKLEIRLAEVISDSTHDMESDPGLEKDGVEATCRRRSRPRPAGAARASGSCGASGRRTSGRST
jgi:hypothetical protein